MPTAFPFREAWEWKKAGGKREREPDNKPGHLGGGVAEQWKLPSPPDQETVLTGEGRAQEDLGIGGGAQHPSGIRKAGFFEWTLLLGNRKVLPGGAAGLVEPGFRSLERGLGWGEGNSDRLLPDSSPACLPRVNDHPRNLATSAWHSVQPAHPPNTHLGPPLVLLPTGN